MINIVANILHDYIKELPWADKTAGLIRVATRTTESGIKQYFPVACNLTEAECNGGRYKDLMPDDRKKSVMYFEDNGGVQYKRSQGSVDFYEAKLRLVGWLNLKLLGQTDCSVTSGAVGDILRAMPGKVAHSIASTYGFTNMLINFDGELKKDVNIFSKYSYNEAQAQYLLFPFDYFALDFTVEFAMNIDCLPTLTPETPHNCNDK
jgi:hypothetical protein